MEFVYALERSFVRDSKNRCYYLTSDIATDIKDWADRYDVVFSIWTSNNGFIILFEDRIKTVRSLSDVADFILRNIRHYAGLDAMYEFVDIIINRVS